MLRRLWKATSFAALVGVAPTLGGQYLATGSQREPQFLLRTASKTVLLDIERTPVLLRRLDLNLDGATLRKALAAIVAQSGLELAYSDDAVPLDRPVQLRATAISVAAALTDVLLDASVDVVFREDGTAALVKRPPP